MTKHKSMLSRLLAQENITIMEDPQAQTASFDLKDRVLHLPVWKGVSEDLEHMLLVHETGHGLDTPHEEWIPAGERIAKAFFGPKFTESHKRLALSFLNVVEDVRIDKRQKRRYPGSKRNYVAAGAELLARDFFGFKKRGEKLENLPFPDRFNIYYKAGIASGVKFTPDEQVLVDRALKLETFEEVEAFTLELMKFSKEQIEKFQAKGDISISVPGSEGKGKKSEEKTEIFAVDIDAESDGEQGEQGEGDIESTGTGENQEGDEDGEQAGGDNGAGPNKGLELNSEENYQETLRNLASKNSGHGVTHCYLPTPVIDNLVDDYKIVLKQMESCVDRGRLNDFRKEALKWRSEEKPTISYMVKEFETWKAADTYAKLSITKTGVIDTNKVHSYRYNEDIFRRNMVVPKGKNHGFVMFVDWSGSMNTNLDATIKQLLSLVMFCKQIQVPFEVYLFKDGDGGGPPKWIYGNEKNILPMDQNLKLRNILSSRMSVDEFLRGVTLLYTVPRYHIHSDTMNGTPLNSTIVAAPEIVNEFRSRNKLQIVNTIFLTDGESNWLGGSFKNPSDSNRWNHSQSYILHDKTTKERRKIANPMGDTKGLTRDLLKVLKDKTDSNLIGFFLYDGSPHSVANMANYTEGGQNVDFDKVKKSWTKDNFLELNAAGYDSYYIIKPAKIDHQGFERFIQQKSPTIKTAKGMANQFTNFMEKKKVNRVLLRNFIANICEQVFDKKRK